MKPIRLATAGIFLAGLLTQICGASAATAVQLGTTGSADSTTITTFIALEHKFFDDEGLAVTWSPAGSAAKAVQQTVAGSLDMGAAATDQALRAIVQGAPIKIVSGSVNAAPFRVIVAKDIPDWAALKGKMLSVGGPHDQTLYFLRRIARAKGLADGDYDLIYAGTTPARFSQLISGVIAGAVLTNPLDFTAVQQGFHDLGATPDYLPTWAQSSIFVNSTWAARNRPAVAAAIRAFKHAADYFYDPRNRDDVVAILMKYTKADIDTARQIHDFYVDKQIVSPGSKLNEQGVQAVLDSLVELGELQKPAPPLATFIDSSFAAEAFK